MNPFGLHCASNPMRLSIETDFLTDKQDWPDPEYSKFSPPGIVGIGADPANSAWPGGLANPLPTGVEELARKVAGWLGYG